MKILLDECLPKTLGRLLVGHKVQTVTQAGWAGIKNGQLLSLAQGQFDVFVTVDQNLVHQQNISKFEIGFLVIQSTSNDINLLRPLLPKILEALSDGPYTGVRLVKA